jgi:hypothetical protein
MAEKYIAACDGCKRVKPYATLPQAQSEATRHGENTGHDIRVYMSMTRQVGFYDGAKKAFELLPDLSRVGA